MKGYKKRFENKEVQKIVDSNVRFNGIIINYSHLWSRIKNNYHTSRKSFHIYNYLQRNPKFHSTMLHSLFSTMQFIHYYYYIRNFWKMNYPSNIEGKSSESGDKSNEMQYYLLNLDGSIFKIRILCFNQDILRFHWIIDHGG